MFNSRPTWNRHTAKAAALFAAFLLLLGTVSFSAWSQSPNADEQKRSDSEGSPRGTTANIDDHLVVPIFPRAQKPSNPEDITSLKDSYIVMQDGSVLSVADWILGSLGKSDIRAGMSDYENRLFLGQVARAAAGLDEEMVLHSFRHAGPLRSFTPYTPPEILRVAQGYLGMIIPALRPNWTPAVETNASKLGTHTERGFTGTILFERQMSEALAQTADDFLYNGTIFTMLKDAANNTQSED